MFKCVIHGWESVEKPCPVCNPEEGSKVLKDGSFPRRSCLVCGYWHEVCPEGGLNG